MPAATKCLLSPRGSLTQLKVRRVITRLGHQGTSPSVCIALEAAVNCCTNICKESGHNKEAAIHRTTFEDADKKQYLNEVNGEGGNQSTAVILSETSRGGQTQVPDADYQHTTQHCKSGSILTCQYCCKPQSRTTRLPDGIRASGRRTAATVFADQVAPDGGIATQTGRPDDGRCRWTRQR